MNRQFLTPWAAGLLAMIAGTSAALALPTTANELMSRASKRMQVAELALVAPSRSVLGARNATARSNLAQANSIVELAPTEPPPAIAAPYSWSATKSADGRVRFEGDVPAASLQQFMAVRAGGDAVDETTVRPDAPNGFSADVRRALDLLPLLQEGQVGFDGDTWFVTGTVTDAVDNAEVAVILGAETSWQLDLTSPIAPVAAEPAAPEAAAAPVTTPSAEATTESEPSQDDAASIAQCEARLDELSGHNAILFQSGAAVITESARAELDAFAAALQLCPQSPVYVEGHTDSDGEDRRNLVLSVQRAEAVVAAMIERGIAAERLYAIGFGESQPIADNATADGKRQNRRIVVTINGEGT
jgi:outer membrane protein OmpA-like peptidoglycan-associated protein